MPEADRLHTLIHSMSRAECAYFSRHVTYGANSKSSNYIRLFKYLKKLDVYNEKHILRKFKNEKFVKNYPVAKKYLLDSIMKSLRSYESEQSIKTQASALMKDAEVYYQKEMIEEAKRMLHRAKQKAYQIEEFRLVLEALNLERKICGQFQTKKINEHIQKILKEEQQVLDQLSNLNTIRQLYYVIYEIIKKKRGLRNAKDLATAKKIISNPALGNYKNAKSFSARVTYLTTYTFYYDLVEDYQSALDSARKLTELWDENEIIKSQQLDRYSSALVNFLNRCFRIDKWDDYEVGLQKLRSIKPSALNMEVRLFERIHHFELYRAHRLLDVEETSQIIMDIEKGLELYDGLIKPNYLSLFYSNISSAYHFLGKFEQALKWNNAFLNFHKMDIQKFAVRYGLMLNLILHYELQEFGVIDHLLRSYKRELKQRKDSFKSENVIISFFRKAIKSFGMKELETVYQNCYDQILELAKDPKEKPYIREIELTEWLESKVRELPYINILREKAGISSAV